MFKINKEFTIEDVPEELKNDLLNNINTDGANFNSFLIGILEVLDSMITDLKETKSIVAMSEIDYILAFDYSAKHIIQLLELEKASIKTAPSIVESIRINCKSIINAVECIRRLQAEKIKSLTPEELLVVLTT